MEKRITYNQEVIKALSEEFGVSSQFVRLCVRGERHSLTAQTIKNKYNELANKTTSAIKKFKQNPVK